MRSGGVEGWEGRGKGKKRVRLTLHKWTLCAVPLEGIDFEVGP